MSAPTKHITNHSNPAEYAAAVTPSDSVSFDQPTRALYVGASGNVNIVQIDGSTVVFVGVQGGSILPVRAIRVNSSSTTASSIVALF